MVKTGLKTETDAYVEEIACVVLTSCLGCAVFVRFFLKYVLKAVSKKDVVITNLVVTKLTLSGLAGWHLCLHDGKNMPRTANDAYIEEIVCVISAP